MDVILPSGSSAPIRTTLRYILQLVPLTVSNACQFFVKHFPPSYSYTCCPLDPRIALSTSREAATPEASSILSSLPLARQLSAAHHPVLSLQNPPYSYAPTYVLVFLVGSLPVAFPPMNYTRFPPLSFVLDAPPISSFLTSSF
jgi:hypothetical protein